MSMSQSPNNSAEKIESLTISALPKNLREIKRLFALNNHLLAVQTLHPEASYFLSLIDINKTTSIPSYNYQDDILRLSNNECVSITRLAVNIWNTSTDNPKTTRTFDHPIHYYDYLKDVIKLSDSKMLFNYYNKGVSYVFELNTTSAQWKRVCLTNATPLSADHLTPLPNNQFGVLQDKIFKRYDNNYKEISTTAIPSFSEDTSKKPSTICFSPNQEYCLVNYINSSITTLFQLSKTDGLISGTNLHPYNYQWLPDSTIIGTNSEEIIQIDPANLSDKKIIYASNKIEIKNPAITPEGQVCFNEDNNLIMFQPLSVLTGTLEKSNNLTTAFIPQTMFNRSLEEKTNTMQNSNNNSTDSTKSCMSNSGG